MLVIQDYKHLVSLLRVDRAHAASYREDVILMKLSLQQLEDIVKIAPKQFGSIFGDLVIAAKEREAETLRLVEAAEKLRLEQDAEKRLLEQNAEQLRLELAAKQKLAEDLDSAFQKVIDLRLAESTALNDVVQAASLAQAQRVETLAAQDTFRAASLKLEALEVASVYAVENHQDVKRAGYFATITLLQAYAAVHDEAPAADAYAALTKPRTPQTMLGVVMRELEERMEARLKANEPGSATPEIASEAAEPPEEAKVEDPSSAELESVVKEEELDVPEWLLSLHPDRAEQKEELGPESPESLEDYFTEPPDGGDRSNQPGTPPAAAGPAAEKTWRDSISSALKRGEEKAKA